MISLGAHPWADYKITGNYINIPEGDKWNLRKWHRVPFLGYVWHRDVAANWLDDSWRWLADAGWKECCLRLWYPGTSDDPQPLPDAVSCVQGVADRVNAAIASGMDVYCVQFDNEPNLEHTHKVLEYEQRMREVVAQWRHSFPTIPLGSPPIAQYRDYLPWAMMIQANAHLFDYICTHYYVGMRQGDTAPGYEGSPEWWHERVPDKPLIITETGNATVQHDLGVLERWMGYDYVRSLHLFILSHPSEFNQWVYTEATGNVIHDLARKWGQTRTWPRGTTVVPPVVPPAPPEGDFSRLREHMSAQNALAEATLQRAAALVERLRPALDEAEQIKGWAQEQDDRVSAVWSEYGLDRPFEPAPSAEGIETEYGRPPADLEAAIMRHFPQEAWRDAARIAYCESGWKRTAEADTRYLGGGRCNVQYHLADGRPALTEWSLGYYQINVCAHGGDRAHWLDADNNVRKASELHASGGWRHWYYSAQKLGLL